MKQTPRFILKSGFIALLTICLSVVGSPWSRASVDRARQTSESTGVLSSLKAPPYQSQWHLAALGVPEALPLPACPVVVAIVDTGLDDSHPALRGRVLPGWNVITPGTPPRDEHGHGTHVAGLIGRIVPTVQLLPVKVANTTGFAEVADVAQGIVWAAEQGADVIYVGLGTDQDQDILREAVKYARSTGAIVVAPSGDTPSQLMYPAAYDHVIAVSSLDQDGNPVESPPQGSRGVFAPGVRLLSAKLGGGYTYKSGSSGAAALGAAVLALGRAVGPDLSSDRLISLLVTPSQDLRISKTSLLPGWGKLRVDRFLLFLVNETRFNATAYIPSVRYFTEKPIDPYHNILQTYFIDRKGTNKLMHVLYKEETHELISLDAVKVVKKEGGIEPSIYETEVRQGSIDEDKDNMPCNHFMQANTKKGLAVPSLFEYPCPRFNNFSALQWALGGDTQDENSYSWSEAIRLYQLGNKLDSYKTLGHVMHLLQDMLQPAHTHLDPHLTKDLSIIRFDDPFELSVLLNYGQWQSNVGTSEVFFSIDEAFNSAARRSYNTNRFYGGINIDSSPESGTKLLKMFDLEIRPSGDPFIPPEVLLKNEPTFGSDVIGILGITDTNDNFWETQIEDGGQGAADEAGYYYIEVPDNAKPAEDGEGLSNLSGKTLTELIARKMLPLAVEYSAGLINLFAEKVDALPPEIQLVDSFGNFENTTKDSAISVIATDLTDSNYKTASGIYIVELVRRTQPEVVVDVEEWSGFPTVSSYFSNLTLGDYLIRVFDGLGNVSEAKFSVVERNIPLPLQGLTISGPSVINEGESAQYSAVAIFSDGSLTETKDVTGDVSWGISLPGVATISSSGLLNADLVSQTTAFTLEASYTLKGMITETKVVVIQDNRTGGVPAIPQGIQFSATVTGTATERWTETRTVEHATIFSRGRQPLSLPLSTSASNYILSIEIPRYSDNTEASISIYKYDQIKLEWPSTSTYRVFCYNRKFPDNEGCSASLSLGLLDPKGIYDWAYYIDNANGSATASFSYVEAIKHAQQTTASDRISDTVTKKESPKNIGTYNVSFFQRSGSTLSNIRYSVSSDNPYVQVEFSDTKSTTTTSSSASLIASTNAVVLSIAVVGNGQVTSSGIDCGTSPGIDYAGCTEIYTSSQSILLTPIPTKGWLFGGWAEDIDCEDGIVSTDSDKVCYAIFLSNLSSVHPACGVTEPNDRPFDLTLTNATAIGSVRCEAVNSITVGPEFIIKNTADVILSAGNFIRLTPEVTVEEGAKFHTLIK